MRIFCILLALSIAGLFNGCSCFTGDPGGTTGAAMNVKDFKGERVHPVEKESEEYGKTLPPEPVEPPAIQQPQKPENINRGTTSGLLGHLKTNRRMMSIHNTSKGPRYTVRSLDGQILDENLSVDELLASHPVLGRMIDQGMAVWAGLDYPGPGLAEKLDSPVFFGP